MDAGTATTSFRSILDKPLKHLTEDDISQLTREDCRKFLKKKGMRRPSWNKSQAIQQVISLKALLEVGDDSGAGALRRALVAPRPPLISVHLNSSSSDSLKEASIGAQVDDSVPCRRKDPPKPALSVEMELASSPAAEAENKSSTPRGACTTIYGADGQMAIFYCGKVNVYDGVPLDKARTILHIAASQVHIPQDDPATRAAALWSSPCHLHTASDKSAPTPASATISQMQTEKMADYPRKYREQSIVSRDHACKSSIQETYFRKPYPSKAFRKLNDVESQVGRKVSLQRYLEKRKDRGRFKNRKDTGLTSSLEMYLTNQVKMPISDGPLCQSITSSPTQPNLAYALHSSVDDRGNATGLNVDLNDKDVQEG